MDRWAPAPHTLGMNFLVFARLRWIVCWASLLVGVAACSRPDPNEPRFMDGGGFRLPDAGTMMMSPPDAGPSDTGPFMCQTTCPNDQVCACLDSQCGCHPPQGYLAPCDPQVPETCASGLSCVRARIGIDRFICSDGREGTPCSKTADICTTRLGCVCLTDITGATNCACTEDPDPNTQLCDRMVPETCAAVCVRAEGPGGAIYFLCSDGAEGRPCERGDGSCQTSLGCTCPLIADRERCRCSEPGQMAGAPCDVQAPGSCVSPLMCMFEQSPQVGRSTVCRNIGPPDGGVGGECQPGDPLSCPPGFSCVQAPGGNMCIPDQ